MTAVPANLGPDAVRRWARPRRLGSAWPLFAVFLLLPIWWALGISGFMLGLCILPLAAGVVLRRALVAPRGFGLYVLFLGWCVAAITRVESSRQAFSAAYRGTLYLAAGLLFLYLLNVPRQRLPVERVMRLMAGFFGIIVIGGVIGMLMPNTSFRTPIQALLPPGMAADQFVQDLVSASTSSGRAFAAYPIYRAKAPFIYANEWGAAYAVTLPFALGALAYMRTKVSRDVLAVLILVSVFPLVFSLNRGAWLSAVGGVLYATLRMARGRNAQLLKAVAVGGLVIGALLFVTPLGDIVQTRLLHGYGDAHRAQLYEESITLVKTSPWLGYGAPVLVEGDLSAGTHGQMWTILVSQGIPGLVLFLGWLVWALISAARSLPPWHPGNRAARFWCEVVIFVAIIQMPYYDLLPWGLALAMVAAAMAWRESMAAPLPRARPGARRRS